MTDPEIPTDPPLEEDPPIGDVPPPEPGETVIEAAADPAETNPDHAVDLKTRPALDPDAGPQDAPDA